MISDLINNRLKYLLHQSDIFSHFGVGKKNTETNDDGESNKKRGKRPPENISDDLDDDERAMLEEEAEGEGEDVTNAHVLSRQPSIINGGSMRYCTVLYHTIYTFC